MRFVLTTSTRYLVYGVWAKGNHEHTCATHLGEIPGLTAQALNGSL